jgi:hypothetical protein
MTHIFDWHVQKTNPLSKYSVTESRRSNRWKTGIWRDDAQSVHMPRVLITKWETLWYEKSQWPRAGARVVEKQGSDTSMHNGCICLKFALLYERRFAMRSLNTCTTATGQIWGWQTDLDFIKQIMPLFETGYLLYCSKVEIEFNQGSQSPDSFSVTSIFCGVVLLESVLNWGQGQRLWALNQIKVQLRAKSLGPELEKVFICLGMVDWGHMTQIVRTFIRSDSA